MLPANDNFQFIPLDELRLFQAQDKAAEAKRKGLAFADTWMLKLTAEGLTPANRRDLALAAADLSHKAKEEANCRLSAIWRR